MARALVLAREPPHPPDAGDRVVTHGLIQALASRGHEVHLLTYARGEDAQRLSALAETCASVSTVPAEAAGADGDPSPRWRKLTRALRGRSDVMAMFDAAAFTEACARRIGELDIDVVVAEHPYMGQPFLREPVRQAMRSTGARPVVNAHVVEHVAHRRRREQRVDGPIDRWLLGLEIPRLQRAEEAVYEAAERVLVLGERDRERLAGAIETPVHLQRVPLDVARYQPRPPSPVDAPRLLFFGSYDWFPNEHGIRRFAEAGFDHVRAAVPDAELLVAGRRAPRAVQRLGEREGVRFLGEVDDLEARVHEASLVLAPIWIGGGVRIKVLESMAWGAPVAATRTALEGVRAETGEEVAAAETPQALAEGVVGLLEAPKERQRLGRRARKRIEADYGLEAVSRELEANLGLG